MNTPVIINGNAQSAWMMIFLSWLIAVVSMLGSLFFSEVMGLEPCVLCWYQRICTYPLVIILLVALFPLDIKVVKYSLPLSIIGLGFALYHYLVYSGYIPESLQPCGQGPSCADVNLELFGFITIPMLSILSYLAIITLLTMSHYRMKP